MAVVFITNNVITMGDRNEQMSFLNNGVKVRNLVLAILCSNGKISSPTPENIRIEIPDRFIEVVNAILDTYKVGHWRFTSDVVDNILPQILHDNFDTPERIPGALNQIIKQAASFDTIIDSLEREKPTVVTAFDGGVFTFIPHKWHSVRPKTKSLRTFLGYLDIKFEGTVKIELWRIRVRHETTFYEMVLPPHLGLIELASKLGSSATCMALRNARCAIDGNIVIDGTTPWADRYMTSEVLSVALKQQISFNAAKALISETN